MNEQFLSSTKNLSAEIAHTVSGNILTRNNFILLFIAWTFLVILSGVWNYHHASRHSIDMARLEAKTIFQHNLAYRRWNSGLGGIYARVTEKNQPNPYLDVPDRDIIASDGTEYTMINPFQMTRMAYDLIMSQSPDHAAINRTVSLESVNPLNKPDDWEREVLLGFEEGRGDDVSEITQINGRPYMRLLMPYIAEDPCLKCHGEQGYEVGDVRGGMSIAVPMKPYFDSAGSAQRTMIMTHLILWILGAGPIFLLSKYFRIHQRQLAESEKKFRIVSEFAHNVEFWVKCEDEIVFISPSCKRITGYSREEFMARPRLLREIIHPEDRERLVALVEDFEQSSHENQEYRIITKSGEERWIAHTGYPIHFHDEFLGRRGCLVDITDRKRLEKQIMQAEKLQCIGHFAGSVAHDFNNILTSIVTFSHLIQDGISNDDDEELKDYIDYMLIACKLGKNLTSNLLVFGKRQLTDPKPIRLNEILIDLSDILFSLLSDEIRCTMSLSEEESLIFADPHQIEQVMINLCTNARDAMPAGGNLNISTEHVQLYDEFSGKYSTIPPGKYIVLGVADTGVGIKEQDLPNIFQTFFTTKGSKGTGLGLNIVKNVVEQQKAYLEVESVVGEGTTFKIFFPARQKAGEF